MVCELKTVVQFRSISSELKKLTFTFPGKKQKKSGAISETRTLYEKCVKYVYEQLQIGKRYLTT
jgi:hypothetical protein